MYVTGKGEWLWLVGNYGPANGYWPTCYNFSTAMPGLAFYPPHNEWFAMW